MKKAVLVTLAATLTSGSVFAMDMDGLDQLGTPPGLTTFGLAGTTYMPTTSVQGTTKDLKNDIINVQGEAIIALETGVVSRELQSVIAKIRIENPALARASDQEIIQAIADQN